MFYFYFAVYENTSFLNNGYSVKANYRKKEKRKKKKKKNKNKNRKQDQEQEQKQETSFNLSKEKGGNKSGIDGDK